MMTLLWSALIVLFLLVGWGIVVFVLRHVREEDANEGYGETRIWIGRKL